MQKLHFAALVVHMMSGRAAAGGGLKLCSEQPFPLTLFWMQEEVQAYSSTALLLRTNIVLCTTVLHVVDAVLLVRGLTWPY